MEIKNHIDFSLTKTDTAVLKGIAICGMLCWHLFYCPNPINMEFAGITRWIAILGDVCVSMFLFCSGYGLCCGYNRLNINIIDCEWGGVRMIKYIISRLIKFYANYWMVFFIFVPIGICVFHQPLTSATGYHMVIDWFRQILAFSGHDVYNSNWWFNTLIIMLYLLFPVLFICIKHACLPTLVVLFLMRRFQLAHTPMDIGIYMFVFSLGIAWAQYANLISNYLNKLPRWGLWVVTSIGLIVPSMWLIMHDAPNIFYIGIHNYNYLTIGLVLLCVLGLRKLPMLSKIFTILGTYSATIYLIHVFIFRYWYPNFFYGLKYPIVIFVVLMATCLFVSWGLEKIKMLTRYNQMVDCVVKKLR